VILSFSCCCNFSSSAFCSESETFLQFILRKWFCNINRWHFDAQVSMWMPPPAAITHSKCLTLQWPSPWPQIWLWSSKVFSRYEIPKFSHLTLQWPWPWSLGLHNLISSSVPSLHHQPKFELETRPCCEIHDFIQRLSVNLLQKIINHVSMVYKPRNGDRQTSVGSL